MELKEDFHKQLVSSLEALRTDRLPWWNVWREIAMYYIPKRYIWLASKKERKEYVGKNGNILDGTGTKAGRVLAAGMMNGITSPSRPWFKLRIPGYDDNLDLDARIWLDEVERSMLQTMAESNFYNALALLYIDLVFFGSGAMLIYEDFESVIRCYNNALGEFYLGQDDRLMVNRFAREFTLKTGQLVSKFGKENCSDSVKNLYNKGQHLDDIEVCHIIEPNVGPYYPVPKTFAFREVYWEKGGMQGKVLKVGGFNEIPGIFPRWEITANDAYGTSPGMDALGDVIQLQHETKRKGQSLDYMVRPPMVMDIQLQHRPTALLPGGQTFVSGANSVGAKPAYQVTPPLAELSADIRDVQTRIREIFHNDLFQMISQLETVRTATEIDARREEKLVQLGPVLERFENEALDPAIKRIYNIMVRKNLLPEPPPSLDGITLEVQYVSILASAQSAVGVIPTERFLQLVGNLSAVYKDATLIPNVEELLRDYARDIGVKAKGLNSREQVAATKEQRAQAQQMEQAAAMAPPAADAAKLLSETDVGGGASALQQLMGG
jgi:hypothetical protein